MGIEIPKSALERMWNEMDWKAAEEQLLHLQQQLTHAAFSRNYERIRFLQNLIVNELDIKCLAVKKVTDRMPPCGTDGVRWNSAALRMKAAFSLTSKGYHASPFREVHIVAKNTGKVRKPSIPTYYDRAMSILYGYSLTPVVEAWSDKNSFAFRVGRSSQDAHSYIVEVLEKQNAPKYMVCADVKGYYAHIHHNWLIENAPMDKRVLCEFLNAGIVFAGELFPSDGTGISEGFSLSPYLGNFVLDGLQRYIYSGLHGTTSADGFDYSEGNLIRYADDILVQTRTRESAEHALELVKHFLSIRGLTISEEKTMIREIKDGFTFLSRTYRKEKGVVYAKPSDKAVERFITELTETIETNKKSQRELITKINAKLKGWAGYHRCADALEAFRKIDAALQAALLEAAIRKHPRQPMAKIISKYWYKDSLGRSVYSLPDDKTVRIYFLADTMLTYHSRLSTRINPYLDSDIIENKTHDREIQNVTGKYRPIWERQEGRCYYCGRKILADQPRMITTRNLMLPPSFTNSAYIHTICNLNELEVIHTDKNISLLREYDVRKILTDIIESGSENPFNKEISEKWKYYKLKLYFKGRTDIEIVLSFAEIEKILGFELPDSARDKYAWWKSSGERSSIADAWLTEGYVTHRIELSTERVFLIKDVHERVSRLSIPKVLTHGELPDNAIFELETHFAYIIKKYGLDKKKD